MTSWYLKPTETSDKETWNKAYQENSETTKNSVNKIYHLVTADPCNSWPDSLPFHLSLGGSWGAPDARRKGEIALWIICRRPKIGKGRVCLHSKRFLWDGKRMREGTDYTADSSPFPYALIRYGWRKTLHTKYTHAINTADDFVLWFWISKKKIGVGSGIRI